MLNIKKVTYQIMNVFLVAMFIIYMGYQFSSFFSIENNSVTFDYSILLKVLIGYVLLLILVPVLLKKLLNINESVNIIGLYCLSFIFNVVGKSKSTKTKNHSIQAQDNEQTIDDYVYEYFVYKRNIDHIMNEQLRSGILVRDFVKETQAILKYSDELMNIAFDSSQKKSSTILTSASAQKNGIKVLYLDKYTVQIKTPHMKLNITPSECKRLYNFKYLKSHLKKYLTPRNIECKYYV